MKNLTVALSAVAASVFLAMSANAAEIYNKNSNKLDLYGKVVGKHYFSSNAKEEGDGTYARLGFKGETQINNQLTGFGQWEYEFKGNKAEKDGSAGDKTRLAYAGLKLENIGSLDYGRNYGVVYDALSYTDVLPEFGPGSVNGDNFFVGRVGGVATYRNTDFFGLVDGLNFAVQYLGKNERDNAGTSNGDGVGGSVSYEYEGFGFVAAYGAADRTNAQEATTFGKGKKAEQWATSVKYDANNLYLAATYGETRNTRAIKYSPGGYNGVANKTEDFAVVAQYQFDFGLRPSLAYIQSKAKDLSTKTGIPEKHNDGYIEKFIEVGAAYYFNKNMSTYVDYKINLLDKNQFTERTDVLTDDIVAVGLTYQF
ncbi:porin [Escherichia coli]|uniref:Porin n=1 Tax=Escherichia coli TaxID=562 RepID=A0A2Y0TER1_ECOLX|nr:porin [Escherichia coli]EEZ8621667.1 porin [Escherichia coli O17]EFN7271472.1 porin [Escherichia coli O21]EEU9478385.1 porin [Escherichia coli]EEU9499798.1 porin [Escherichia coli]EEW1476335.1 porin [Escherichia coli]